MSRTVCSWCKAPLVLKDDILVCSNIDCPACDEKYLHEELICTRKALDVALDWLGQVATPEKCDDDLCREFTKRKLAEIKTALEQKGKQCWKI